MSDVGPTEKALGDAWLQARARLYSWRGVPTWLTLNRRFTLRLQRASRVKVVVPASLLPNCEQCVDLCCTGPNALVSLRLLDIARLVDAGLDAFITPRSAAQMEAEPGKKRRPSPSDARRRLEASVFAQMFPVLARDETQTCRLLTTERHCGAHPAWPLSCRRYPYAFDAQHNVIFLAQGCSSHRTLTIDDAPDAVRQLVHAAVATYNERVKDIIMLHSVLPALWELGLLRYLELAPKLADQATALGPSPAPLSRPIEPPTSPSRALPIVR